MKNLRKASKRILYRLSKQSFTKLRKLNAGLGTGSEGTRADLQVLRRLIKKGLVIREVAGAGYGLTKEGRKVAEKIIQEIDEYKKW